MSQVKINSQNKPSCPNHGPQDTSYSSQTAPCGCRWVWEGKILVVTGDWGGARPGAGRPPVNFRIEFDSPEIARWFAGLSNEERVRVVASVYGKAHA